MDRTMRRRRRQQPSNGDDAGPKRTVRQDHVSSNPPLSRRRVTENLADLRNYDDEYEPQPPEVVDMSSESDSHYDAQNTRDRRSNQRMRNHDDRDEVVYNYNGPEDEEYLESEPASLDYNEPPTRRRSTPDRPHPLRPVDVEYREQTPADVPKNRSPNRRRNNRSVSDVRDEGGYPEHRRSVPDVRYEDDRRYRPVEVDYREPEEYIPNERPLRRRSYNRSVPDVRAADGYHLSPVDVDYREARHVEYVPNNRLSSRRRYNKSVPDVRYEYDQQFGPSDVEYRETRHMDYVPVNRPLRQRRYNRSVPDVRDDYDDRLMPVEVDYREPAYVQESRPLRRRRRYGSVNDARLVGYELRPVEIDYSEPAYDDYAPRERQLYQRTYHRSVPDVRVEYDRMRPVEGHYRESDDVEYVPVRRRRRFRSVPDNDDQGYQLRPVEIDYSEPGHVDYIVHDPAPVNRRNREYTRSVPDLRDERGYELQAMDIPFSSSDSEPDEPTLDVTQPGLTERFRIEQFYSEVAAKIEKDMIRRTRENDFADKKHIIPQMMLDPENDIEETIQLRGTLLNCVEIHNQNATAYHKFHGEVDDLTKQLEEALDCVDLNWEDITEETVLGDPNDVKELLQDTIETYVGWWPRLDKIKEKCASIVPLWCRTTPSEGKTPAVALCDYIGYDVSLQAGEKIVIADTTDENDWLIINSRGKRGAVPAPCCLIPPPDKRSLESANKLTQKLLCHWRETVSRIRRVVQVSKTDVPASKLKNLRHVKRSYLRLQQKLHKFHELVSESQERHTTRPSSAPRYRSSSSPTSGRQSDAEMSSSSGMRRRVASTDGEHSVRSMIRRFSRASSNDSDSSESSFFQPNRRQGTPSRPRLASDDLGARRTWRREREFGNEQNASPKRNETYTSSTQLRLQKDSESYSDPKMYYGSLGRSSTRRSEQPERDSRGQGHDTQGQRSRLYVRSRSLPRVLKSRNNQMNGYTVVTDDINYMDGQDGAFENGDFPVRVNEPRETRLEVKLNANNERKGTQHSERSSRDQRKVPDKGAKIKSGNDSWSESYGEINESGLNSEVSDHGVAPRSPEHRVNGSSVDSGYRDATPVEKGDPKNTAKRPTSAEVTRRKENHDEVHKGQEDVNQESQAPPRGRRRRRKKPEEEEENQEITQIMSSTVVTTVESRPAPTVGSVETDSLGLRRDQRHYPEKPPKDMVDSKDPEGDGQGETVRSLAQAVVKTVAVEPKEKVVSQVTNISLTRSRPTTPTRRIVRRLSTEMKPGDLVGVEVSSDKDITRIGVAKLEAEVKPQKVTPKKIETNGTASEAEMTAFRDGVAEGKVATPAVRIESKTTQKEATISSPHVPKIMSMTKPSQRRVNIETSKMQKSPFQKPPKRMSASEAKEAFSDLNEFKAVEESHKVVQSEVFENVEENIDVMRARLDDIQHMKVGVKDATQTSDSSSESGITCIEQEPRRQETNVLTGVGIKQTETELQVNSRTHSKTVTPQIQGNENMDTSYEMQEQSVYLHSEFPGKNGLISTVRLEPEVLGRNYQIQEQGIFLHVDDEEEDGEEAVGSVIQNTSPLEEKAIAGRSKLLRVVSDQIRKRQEFEEWQPSGEETVETIETSSDVIENRDVIEDVIEDVLGNDMSGSNGKDVDLSQRITIQTQYDMISGKVTDTESAGQSKFELDLLGTNIGQNKTDVNVDVRQSEGVTLKGQVSSIVQENENRSTDSDYESEVLGLETELDTVVRETKSYSTKNETHFVESGVSEVEAKSIYAKAHGNEQVVTETISSMQINSSGPSRSESIVVKTEITVENREHELEIVEKDKQDTEPNVDFDTQNGRDRSVVVENDAMERETILVKAEPSEEKLQLNAVETVNNVVHVAESERETFLIKAEPSEEKLQLNAVETVNNVVYVAEGEMVLAHPDKVDVHVDIHVIEQSENSEVGTTSFEVEACDTETEVRVEERDFDLEDNKANVDERTIVTVTSEMVETQTFVVEEEPVIVDSKIGEVGTDTQINGGKASFEVSVDRIETTIEEHGSEVMRTESTDFELEPPVVEVGEVMIKKTQTKTMEHTEPETKTFKEPRSVVMRTESTDIELEPPVVEVGEIMIKKTHTEANIIEHTEPETKVFGPCGGETKTVHTETVTVVTTENGLDTQNPPYPMENTELDRQNVALIKNGDISAEHGGFFKAEPSPSVDHRFLNIGFQDACTLSPDPYDHMPTGNFENGKRKDAVEEIDASVDAALNIEYRNTSESEQNKHFSKVSAEKRRGLLRRSTAEYEESETERIYIGSDGAGTPTTSVINGTVSTPEVNVEDIETSLEGRSTEVGFGSGDISVGVENETSHRSSETEQKAACVLSVEEFVGEGGSIPPNIYFLEETKNTTDGTVERRYIRNSSWSSGGDAVEQVTEPDARNQNTDQGNRIERNVDELTEGIDTRDKFTVRGVEEITVIEETEDFAEVFGEQMKIDTEEEYTDRGVDGQIVEQIEYTEDEYTDRGVDGQIVEQIEYTEDEYTDRGVDGQIEVIDTKEETEARDIVIQTGLSDTEQATQGQDLEEQNIVFETDEEVLVRGVEELTVIGTTHESTDRISEGQTIVFQTESTDRVVEEQMVVINTEEDTTERYVEEQIKVTDTEWTNKDRDIAEQTVAIGTEEDTTSRDVEEQTIAFETEEQVTVRGAEEIGHIGGDSTDIGAEEQTVVMETGEEATAGDFGGKTIVFETEEQVIVRGVEERTEIVQIEGNSTDIGFEEQTVVIETEEESRGKDTEMQTLVTETEDEFADGHFEEKTVVIETNGGTTGGNDTEGITKMHSIDKSEFHLDLYGEGIIESDETAQNSIVCASEDNIETTPPRLRNGDIGAELDERREVVIENGQFASEISPRTTSWDTVSSVVEGGHAETLTTHVTGGPESPRQRSFSTPIISYLQNRAGGARPKVRMPAPESVVTQEIAYNNTPPPLDDFSGMSPLERARAMIQRHELERAHSLADASPSPEPAPARPLTATDRMRLLMAQHEQKKADVGLELRGRTQSLDRSTILTKFNNESRNVVDNEETHTVHTQQTRGRAKKRLVSEDHVDGGGESPSTPDSMASPRSVFDDEEEHQSSLHSRARTQSLDRSMFLRSVSSEPAGYLARYGPKPTDRFVAPQVRTRRYSGSNLLDSSSHGTADVSESDGIMTVTEFEKKYQIENVVDPWGTKMSLAEAVQNGIIDMEAGIYRNAITGNSMNIDAAIVKKLVHQKRFSIEDKLRSREERWAQSRRETGGSGTSTPKGLSPPTSPTAYRRTISTPTLSSRSTISSPGPSPASSLRRTPKSRGSSSGSKSGYGLVHFTCQSSPVPSKIKYVANTMLGESMTFEVAKRCGIVDPESEIFTDKKGGRRLTFDQAIEEGLMEVDTESSGVVNGSTHSEESYLVYGVMDQAGRRWQSLKDAMEQGIISRTQGTYRDTNTNETFPIRDAIDDGNLIKGKAISGRSLEHYESQVDDASVLTVNREEFSRSYNRRGVELTPLHSSYMTI